MKNVLIVKVIAIGDVVMSLSILTWLKVHSPDTKVTWVCGNSVAPLLKEIGGIHKLVIVDEKKLFKGSFFQRIQAIFSIWKDISFKQYDVFIKGHNDFRYNILSVFVSASVRRSFSYSSKRMSPVPGRYHSDEYLKLLTGKDDFTAIKSELPKLCVPLPYHLIDELTVVGAKKIAMSPGGANNILSNNDVRRWDINNYVQLAELLINNGFTVILTGAPSDIWVSPYFIDLGVIDLIGKTSLLDLIAVFGFSDLIVTHDSGPLHLAKLSGKPIVALFGPTSPHSFGSTDPLIDMDLNQIREANIPASVNVFWGGHALPCRPCYDGKYYASCSNNLCMSSILPSSVYAKIIKIILQSESNLS